MVGNYRQSRGPADPDEWREVTRAIHRRNNAPTNPKDDHRQKLPSAKQCEAIFANRKHHGRDSAETVPANQQRTQHEADNGKRNRKLFQRVLVSIARHQATGCYKPLMGPKYEPTFGSL